MSKFWSKFDIFTIDLRVILSIIVATGVYALLLKFLQNNSPHNVQTKGGGVKGFLNNVKKNALFSRDGFPYRQISFLLFSTLPNGHGHGHGYGHGHGHCHGERLKPGA